MNWKQTYLMRRLSVIDINRKSVNYQKGPPQRHLTSMPEETVEGDRAGLGEQPALLGDGSF